MINSEIMKGLEIIDPEKLKELVPILIVEIDKLLDEGIALDQFNPNNHEKVTQLYNNMLKILVRLLALGEFTDRLSHQIPLMSLMVGKAFIVKRILELELEK